jgi:hypothetical protein
VNLPVRSERVERGCPARQFFSGCPWSTARQALTPAMLLCRPSGGHRCLRHLASQRSDKPWTAPPLKNSAHRQSDHDGGAYPVFQHRPVTWGHEGTANGTLFCRGWDTILARWDIKWDTILPWMGHHFVQMGHEMGHHSTPMGHHFVPMGHEMGHQSAKTGHEGTPTDAKVVSIGVMVKQRPVEGSLDSF